MNQPTTPKNPPSKPSVSHLSIIILGSFVVIIGIIVAAHNNMTTPENQRPLSSSEKKSAPLSDPDILDEEIDQQIRTLNSGSTLTDINKDIETTDITATDKEIQFLEQEMQTMQ